MATLAPDHGRRLREALASSLDAGRHQRLALVTQRARARLRYFWSDLPPDGVELLSAALSLSFGLVLVWRGRDSSALASAYPYAALCFVACATKLGGVVFEIGWLRILGLLLGVIFWITVSVAFYVTIPGSISWLCFAVMAIAQLWAVRQVFRLSR